jgi:Leucine-rich repeat (LRR) protein
VSSSKVRDSIVKLDYTGRNLVQIPDERHIFAEVAYEPCKIQCDNNIIKQIKGAVACNVVILSLSKNLIEKFDFSVLPAKIREVYLSCNKISRF